MVSTCDDSLISGETVYQFLLPSGITLQALKGDGEFWIVLSLNLHHNRQGRTELPSYSLTEFLFHDWPCGTTNFDYALSLCLFA